MFDRLIAMVHGIKVEQKGEIVSVYGTWTQALLEDMKTVWKTSSGANNMFILASSAKLMFYSFFLPDFYKTLDMIANATGTKLGATRALKIQEEVFNNTWLKKLNEPYQSFLDRSKLKSFKFQPDDNQLRLYDTFERVTQQMGVHGIINDSAPGSGKTYAGLTLGAMLNADVEVYVVPKNAVNDVWKKTIIDHNQTEGGFWCSLDGKPLEVGYKKYVVHFDMLLVFLDFYLKSGLFRKRVYIHVDECHNFNELAAARTIALIDLHIATPNRYTLWGSGTPFKAIGLEIIPFCKANDDLFTDEVEKQFVKIYGKGTLRGHEILSARIAMLSHVVKQNGVPDPTQKEIKISLPNGNDYTLATIKREMQAFVEERMAYYDSISEETKRIFTDCVEIYRNANYNNKQAMQDLVLYQKYIALIRSGYDAKEMKEQAAYCKKFEEKVIIPSLPDDKKKVFKKVRSIYKYVALVVQGEALGTVLGSKREKCITDLAMAIDIQPMVETSIKKTMIYSNYVKPILAIDKRLKDMGYNTLLVYGDTNPRLDSIMKAFNTDESANPLVATFKSLSTAVPATAASRIITLDDPFRDYILKQTMARIARRGQDTETEFWRVYLDTGTEPNISTRAADICNWSKENVAILTGGEPITTSEETILMGAYENASPKGIGLGKVLIDAIAQVKSLLKNPLT